MTLAPIDPSPVAQARGFRGVNRLRIIDALATATAYAAKGNVSGVVRELQCVLSLLGLGELKAEGAPPTVASLVGCVEL